MDLRGWVGIARGGRNFLVRVCVPIHPGGNAGDRNIAAGRDHRAVRAVAAEHDDRRDPGGAHTARGLDAVAGRGADRHVEVFDARKTRLTELAGALQAATTCWRMPEYSGITKTRSMPTAPSPASRCSTMLARSVICRLPA